MRTLYMPISFRGGVGKTTFLTLIANYLKAHGKTIAIIDCDIGNRDKMSGIGNFFSKGVQFLDLRVQRDLDTILEMTAETQHDVICDMPSNSKCNLERWLEEVATPETFSEMGIRLIALAPLATTSGSIQSAVEGINMIGQRGKIIVGLNRLSSDYDPKPAEAIFSEWYSIDTSSFDLHTIEIPNLDKDSMIDLVKGHELPFRLNGNMRYLCRKRIHAWTDKVDAQLDQIRLLGEEPQAVAL